MNREVGSGTAEKRTARRPKRVIAVLAAVVAAVGGMAFGAVPAAADGLVQTPRGYGYAGFSNRSDGSEVVYVCDGRTDSIRVWATFRFPGSTEEALWAPNANDCNFRMPGMREGTGPVSVNVCESDFRTYSACSGYRYLGYA